MLTRVASRLRALLARRRANDEANEELQFHLEHETTANIARGMSLKEARRRALADLGGVTQTREAVRGVRATWLDAFWQDVRYAVRGLRRTPGFSAAAVSMLTLGIGVVVGGSTIANGLFLRPWAVPEGDRVFVADAQRREQPSVGRVVDGFSYGAYEHIRANARVADYVAMTKNYLSVREEGVGPSPGSRVPEAMFATENTVEVLKIHIQRGSGFAKGSPGAQVLLSDALWRRQFGADPAVVGRTVWLSADYLPATVIGVMAPAFDSLGTTRTDLFVNLGAVTAVGRNRAALLSDPTSCCVMIAGRLRPGSTRVQAAEELKVLTAQYRQSVNQRELVVSVQDTTPSGALWDRAKLVVALGGTGLALVFALTCANVGNLYLARSLRRRQEMTVRLSLGATRGRLVRQLLTEGLVMAALAGYAAFLVAWSIPRIVTWFDEGPGSAFAPDWRVAAVTAFAVIAACLLVALAPALHTTRTLWRTTTLRLSAAGRMRGVVLAAQIAIATVFVLSATLLVRGILHASSAPTDYALRTTTIASIAAPGNKGYDKTLLRQLVTGANRSPLRPGIVATVNRATLGIGRTSITVASGAEFQPQLLSMTSPTFAVLGVPLVAGRWMSDDADAGEALINETLARALSPYASAVGQAFELSFDRRRYVITGVVRDAHLTAFERIDPMVFIPPVSGMLSLVLKTTPDSDRQASTLVASINPDLNVAVTPLSESAKEALTNATGGAIVGGGFGLVALLLAVIGIGGVFSYLVEERQREIGIRLALGGSRWQIASTLGRACRRAIVGGLMMGLLLSMMAGFALRSFLFGLNPLDPVSYAFVAAVLASAALVATALPLRRALRVDPAISLRAE